MSSETSGAGEWAALLDTEVADVIWERGHQARLLLATGQEVFAKVPAGAALARLCQAAEVAGLRWLGETGTVQVAGVVADGPGAMATAWIDQGAATTTGAEEFGRALGGC